MKEPQGCSTPFPASAASPALPARGMGLGPRSLRGGTWGLRLLPPVPPCALGMRQDQRRAFGIRDTAAETPGPWTLKSHPSRLHAPAWIRAGSRGDLWRAAGKEGQRRCKQALRFHFVTRSRDCVPVSRSSPSSPWIHPPQGIPCRASQPAQGPPHRAPGLGTRQELRAASSL